MHQPSTNQQEMQEPDPGKVEANKNYEAARKQKKTSVVLRVMPVPDQIHTWTSQFKRASQIP